MVIKGGSNPPLVTMYNGVQLINKFMNYGCKRKKRLNH